MPGKKSTKTHTSAWFAIADSPDAELAVWGDSHWLDHVCNNVAGPTHRGATGLLHSRAPRHQSRSADSAAI